MKLVNIKVIAYITSLHMIKRDSLSLYKNMTPYFQLPYFSDKIMLENKSTPLISELLVILLYRKLKSMPARKA